ncbi:NUDIX hydrolase [Saxibacter everestensis]|uniref:NUDIX hydrolase n=1 Tax=Saxibacter everestensis TaxID=2909229 RepID=A0ABY8QVA0_9MICO|nr:NUDIX hydrolase [Brevibacteriaceae bacterium ZFBP1038]
MSKPLTGSSTDPESGDGWVYGPDETRYWGRYGAAGALIHDVDRGILLQHRVQWSHFGGTWGIPGGARHRDETAVAAALRECSEEAGVPAVDGTGIRLRASYVLDLGFWSYTTVLSDATTRLNAQVTDRESLEVAWVPLGSVDSLPLHPGFAASWPVLSEALGLQVTLVVDVANVVGSRPDGWWKDRSAAAQKFVARLGALAETGIDVGELDLPGTVGGTARRWWPQEILAVVEGQAKGDWIADVNAASDGAGPRVIAAAHDGDSAIVQATDETLGAPGHAEQKPDPVVIVVTADRELRGRVGRLGAQVRSPRWLLDKIPG